MITSDFFFPLLRPLLLSIYKELYNFDFLRSLLVNVTEEEGKEILNYQVSPDKSDYMKEQDIENEHFIKYG